MLTEFSLSAELHGQFDDLLDRGRLHSLAVSSDGFAFDPQSGQSFNINSSGVLALTLMRDTGSLERSVAELAHRYDVPYAIVRGSVEVFVRQLTHCLT